jgi:hypothetical protein
MTSRRPRITALTVLLRLAGGVTLTAFFAMVLPAAWMASAHHALGFGDWPQTPVFEYLARSIAALYGFHGGLLVLISRDPARHVTIVNYMAVMYVAFGLIVLAIDLDAGMPTWWTAGEGPPLVMVGLLIAYLARDLRRS